MMVEHAQVEQTRRVTEPAVRHNDGVDCGYSRVLPSVKVDSPAVAPPRINLRDGGDADQ